MCTLSQLVSILSHFALFSAILFLTFEALSALSKSGHFLASTQHIYETSPQKPLPHHTALYTGLYQPPFVWPFPLLSEANRQPSKRRKRKSSAGNSANNANSKDTSSGGRQKRSPGPQAFNPVPGVGVNKTNRHLINYYMSLRYSLWWVFNIFFYK